MEMYKKEQSKSSLAQGIFVVHYIGCMNRNKQEPLRFLGCETVYTSAKGIRSSSNAGSLDLVQSSSFGGVSEPMQIADLVPSRSARSY